MPRYIDADALLRTVIKSRRFFVSNEDVYRGIFAIETTYEDLARVIEEMPAADVVEVVRCKDCIFGELQGDGTVQCRRHLFVCLKSPTHFCGYGERK